MCLTSNTTNTTHTGEETQTKEHRQGNTGKETQTSEHRQRNTGKGTQAMGDSQANNEPLRDLSLAIFLQ